MTEGRASTFAAFASRDFRLLWGGQTISIVGDAAFIVALGRRVTDLTGIGAAVWRRFWIGIGIAAWVTLINELVPEHLLSRVFGFDFFGSMGLMPVGFVPLGWRQVPEAT